jgi:glycosyltransferase involved in cell wall biosynthesis
MKVAQVSLRFDAPGGVETTVRALAVGLAQRGDSVRVYASDLYDEGQWERRSNYPPQVDGVPVSRFPVFKRMIPGLTMPMMSGLIDALAADRPEILHAHSHRYGHVLQAAAVAHRLKLPFIVSTHYHPADLREPPLKRGLLRIQDVGFGMTAYRVADGLIVETEREAHQLAEFAPRERIHVIPPGLDLASWTDGGSAPAPLPTLPERFMLYSGRVAPNKGLPFLLDSLARIPPAERPALVLMGRDWGVRAQLDAQARSLGLADAMHWLGHVSDPAMYRAVFRRARLFVLPSEYEAFGLVLLEAMAAGVPTVATAVGGMPEVLDHGRAGTLVPYGDTTAMANAIRRLLEGSERDRCIAEGRRRVREYSSDLMVERHRALYAELARAG